MDRSQRSGKARVERIEEGSGLDSPNFAKDDSVGSESKRIFQEVIKRDVGLEGTRYSSHFLQVPGSAPLMLIEHQS